MKFNRLSKERLFSLLVNRLVIFFFLMCVLTLFLFIAGTVQDFIDSTQLFLLNLYNVLGVLLIAASFLGMIFDLYRFAKTRKARYLPRAGGYILLAVFGIFTVLMASAITAISSGNGAG